MAFFVRETPISITKCKEIGKLNESRKADGMNPKADFEVHTRGSKIDTLHKTITV